MADKGKRHLKRALVAAIAVLAVVAAVCVALLARHGAFASERELGPAEVEQVLEEGYGRDFELVSEEDDVRVAGKSPRLDAASEPVSFDVGFEHVYRFRDADGLECTVWQQYRRESDGGLAKANQLYDDYYWQQLKPRLRKALARHARDWPGSWELVETPLHPHLEVSIARFSDLDKLEKPLKTLRSCVRGLAYPRENAASFHAAESPFADLEHLPVPLTPRVDVMAARASSGGPFLVHWFTPFGDVSEYHEESSARAFAQMRAEYARCVQNGEISERLSRKTVAANLSNSLTRTSFLLGGYGPKSSNDFTWSYSARAHGFVIAGSELPGLVEEMGGWYRTAQEGGGRQTQWNIGDTVWSATPIEGADGSFDEGSIDLTGVSFSKDGRPLAVFDPDTPDALKRSYTLSQLEELLGAEISTDLDSGTVIISANPISGSRGIGLD